MVDSARVKLAVLLTAAQVTCSQCNGPTTTARAHRVRSQGPDLLTRHRDAAATAKMQARIDLAGVPALPRAGPLPTCAFALLPPRLQYRAICESWLATSSEWPRRIPDEREPLLQHVASAARWAQLNKGPSRGRPFGSGKRLPYHVVAQTSGQIRLRRARAKMSIGATTAGVNGGRILRRSARSRPRIRLRREAWHQWQGLIV